MEYWNNGTEEPEPRVPGGEGDELDESLLHGSGDPRKQGESILEPRNLNRSEAELGEANLRSKQR